MSYNTLLRKSSSHVHKLVMLMFDIVITNCHTLAKNYTNLRGREACGRSFRRSLVDVILSANPVENQDDETLFISYLFLRARKENVAEAVSTTVKAKKRRAIFARLVKASLLFVPSIITTFIRSISSSGLLFAFRVIHRISAGILFQLSTLLRILCLPFYAAMPFLSLLGRA